MKELLNFGLEKLLSIKSIVRCFGGAGKTRMLRVVQMVEVWYVKFQSARSLCQEYCVKNLWCLVSRSRRSEESAVINKRPELLK